MFSFFIPLLAALQLLAAPVGASEAARTVSAQVAPALTLAGRRSNQMAQISLSERKGVAVLTSQKRQLRVTYNAQLSKVDALKRGRASWRRDRKLGEQKGRTQQTALALEAVDVKLRAARVRLKRARLNASGAIEAELLLNPSSARVSYLREVLRRVGVRTRTKPKKIAIPDLELDEFADPEELLEQISLIERAAAKLVEQEASLRRRAQHFSSMDALRSKRRRAEELVSFDDTGVRRSTGRARGTSGSSGDDNGADSSGFGAQSAGAEQPGGPEAPPESGGGSPSSETGGFEASSIVLYDVVDAGTQDALRRAYRSSDPRTKADAAKRAQDQVHLRILRLEASKDRIRQHLRLLSRQR